jgi:hypothetical protein
MKDNNNTDKDKEVDEDKYDAYYYKYFGDRIDNETIYRLHSQQIVRVEEVLK